MSSTIGRIDYFHPVSVIFFLGDDGEGEGDGDDDEDEKSKREMR